MKNKFKFVKEHNRQLEVKGSKRNEKINRLHLPRSIRNITNRLHGIDGSGLTNPCWLTSDAMECDNCRQLPEGHGSAKVSSPEESMDTKQVPNEGN